MGTSPYKKSELLPSRCRGSITAAAGDAHQAEFPAISGARPPLTRCRPA
jgi:hypothetical protein